jgi:MFS family permease
MLLLGGLFLISSLASDVGLWLIVLTILIAGSGLSIFLPANNSSIMGNVPLRNLGSASSFLAGSRAVGTSIGIALAAAAYTTLSTRERVDGAPSIENGSADSFEKALLLVIVVSLIGIPVILARGKEQGQK